MQLAEKEKRLIIVVSSIIAVCVGAPTLATTYSSEYKLEKQGQVRALQAEINLYETDIAGIDERRELLRTNRADYTRLVEAGVVGKQDPVRWVELMQEIQQRRGLFPTKMKWSVGEMALSPASSPMTADSTVGIVFRELNIEMPMLHDLDVLMFLGDLRRQSGSYFFPVDCNFQRQSMDFELARRENLLANCKIDWVSVSDPESNILNPEQAPAAAPAGDGEGAGGESA